MNKILRIVVLLGYCSSAYGQQFSKQIPINLPTILKLAGAKNLTIKQYDLVYQRSQAEIDKADEWYLPTLYIGPEGHYLQGAVMNTNGTILDYITQKEMWLGGGFSAEWDFSNCIYNVMAKKQQSEAIKNEGQAQRNGVILKAISA